MTPTDPDFVVGVDGGGSGCRVLLLNSGGEVLGEGVGSPALIRADRPGAATAVIRETVRRTAEDQGLALPCRALWAGLAGAGQMGPREAEEVALRSSGLAREVRVGKDVEGAHRDAFGSEAGILLVVGTGSMVWGRDPEGREVRVGGWGAPLGDEGSGYWLGMEGLRAVTRHADGRGPATLLTPKILERLHLPDPGALASWVATASKGDVAALAPLVIRTAGRGDAPAVTVVERAMVELRGLLSAARNAWAPWGPSFPLALVGGLVEEGAPLRPGVVKTARELGARVSLKPVLPARGAARLALEMVGPG